MADLTIPAPNTLTNGQPTIGYAYGGQISTTPPPAGSVAPSAGQINWTNPDGSQISPPPNPSLSVRGQSTYGDYIPSTAKTGDMISFGDKLNQAHPAVQNLVQNGYASPYGTSGLVFTQPFNASSLQSQPNQMIYGTDKAGKVYNANSPEVQAEMKNSPGLNLDAAIGNVVMKSNQGLYNSPQEQPQQMSLSDMLGKLTGAGITDINTLATLTGATPGQIQLASNTLPSAGQQLGQGLNAGMNFSVNALGGNASQLQPMQLPDFGNLQQQEQDLLAARQKSNDDAYQNMLSSINSQYNQLSRSTGLEADQNSAQNYAYLARLGAMGNSTAAMGYMNGMAAQKSQAMSQIEGQRQSALANAYQAYQTGNNDLLDKAYQNAKDIEFKQADLMSKQWDQLAKAHELQTNDFKAMSSYVLGAANLNLSADKLQQASDQFAQTMKLDQAKFNELVAKDGQDAAIKWAETTGYYADPTTGKLMPTVSMLKYDLAKTKLLGGGGSGGSSGLGNYNQFLSALNNAKGSDGYVNTDTYKSLRTTLKTEAERKEFDQNFGHMLNPLDPTAQNIKNSLAVYNPLAGGLPTGPTPSSDSSTSDSGSSTDNSSTTAWLQSLLSGG